MYESIQFAKTTSSRNKETNARSRTLKLLSAISGFVALAIPVQLSARTITKFDPPGSVDTFPYSINPTGAITGE